MNRPACRIHSPTNPEVTLLNSDTDQLQQGVDALVNKPS